MPTHIERRLQVNAMRFNEGDPGSWPAELKEVNHPTLGRIYIIPSPGERVRVEHGDWIVRLQNGTILTMSDARFNLRFEPI